MLKILLLLLFSTTLWAKNYELIVIQAISSSRKTFITRTGKRQGILQGLKATFNAGNASVIAKATQVTSQFTHWEIVNKKIQAPFEQGDVVTYFPAEEYTWAVVPESVRKELIYNEIPHPQNSFIAKGGVARALSESTTEVSDQSPQRGGIMLEVLAEKELGANFAIDGGFRYDRETVNLAESSLITQRIFGLAHLTYYFDPLLDYYKAKFYLSMGLGFGQSATESVGITSSGTAALLPSTKLGVQLPIDKRYHFLIEGAFESIQSRETLPNDTTQTTTQNNGMISVGLKRYF